MPAAAHRGAGRATARALVAAGAIAAFLATSSGLLVSIAGALATDVLRGRVRDFRMAALIGGSAAAAAGAGGVDLGTVPQRRVGVRRRRVHAVSAAGAGNLVAGSDRSGRDRAG